MNYLYLFDENGTCTARIAGVSADLIDETAKRNGAVVHWVSDDERDIAALRLIDGQPQTVLPVVRVPDYRVLRYAAYPPIGEQLDALWHAMRDGTLPMIEGFYDRIAAVKAAHPKE